MTPPQVLLRLSFLFEYGMKTQLLDSYVNVYRQGWLYIEANRGEGLKKQILEDDSLLTHILYGYALRCCLIPLVPSLQLHPPLSPSQEPVLIHFSSVLHQSLVNRVC